MQRTVSKRLDAIPNDDGFWKRKVETTYASDAWYVDSDAFANASSYVRRFQIWADVSRRWRGGLKLGADSTAGATMPAVKGSWAPSHIVETLGNGEIFCVNALGNERFAIAGGGGAVNVVTLGKSDPSPTSSSRKAAASASGACRPAASACGAASASAASTASSAAFELVTKARFECHDRGILGMSTDIASQTIVTGAFNGEAAMWHLNLDRLASLNSLSIKKLKQTMDDRKIPYADLNEKSELVTRLTRFMPIAERLCSMNHDHGETVVSTSHCGDFAITGSRDGTAKVWRIKPKIGAPQSQGPSFGMSLLDVPRGSHSMTATEALVLRGHDQGVDAVHYDQCNQRAFSGGKDGDVRVWDLVTGQCTSKFDHGDCWVWMVKSHAMWYDTTGIEPGAPPRRSAGVDDDHDAELETGADGEDGGSSGSASKANIISNVNRQYWGDGRKLFTGTTNGEVRLYDLRTNTATRTVRLNLQRGQEALFGMGDGNQVPITGIAPMFTHHRFVTSSFDGKVRVWDERMFRPVLVLPSSSGQRLARCEVTPTMIAAGCMDGTAQVWSFLTNELRSELAGSSIAP